LIGRYPEAGRDNLEALDIPARAPNTDARLIDLSAFYTASLTEDLHGGVGLNFAALQPFGIKRLGGVDFDVRGIVHLFGRWHEPELVVHGRPISDSDYLEFPKAMREIPIRQKAKTLHFLHAAGFIFGTNVYEMVRFVLHYGDGEERTMPMLHGRDIGDWTEDLYRPNPIDSEVVWTGSNPWVQREEFRKYGRGKIRLFKSSRPNPLPDVEITALDYISLTDGAPFLVAITVE